MCAVQATVTVLSAEQQIPTKQKYRKGISVTIRLGYNKVTLHAIGLNIKQEQSNMHAESRVLSITTRI